MDHTTQEASTVYCGVTCAFAGTIPCGEKFDNQPRETSADTTARASINA